MTRTHPYDSGLEKNEANFVALSPLSFIERTAADVGKRTDNMAAGVDACQTPIYGASDHEPAKPNLQYRIAQPDHVRRRCR